MAFLLYVFEQKMTTIRTKKPSRSISLFIFLFFQMRTLMSLVWPNRPKAVLQFPLSPLRSIRLH